jgi:hypothetical protein
VRFELLAAVAGRGGWNEQFSVPHPLPLAYVDVSDDDYVVPLNATVAARVLDLASREDQDLLLESFIRLANGLAPRVNRDAIRQRNPEARLAGRLFDYDTIVSGFLGGRAEKFYLATQKTWQWNSRYWEQVALLYLARYQSQPSTVEGKDALKLAVQHARHAVAIELHPFPLTTLGKVLLGQLREAGVQRSTIYYQAVGFLTRAIRIERSWARPTVQPFITLFRGTREFVATGGKLNARQMVIVQSLIRQAKANFADDIEMLQSISEVEAVIGR